MSTTRKAERKIEIISEFKIIRVREAEIILEGGFEIGRTPYHSFCVTPADNPSDYDQEIQALMSLYHTQELKDAYASRLD